MRALTGTQKGISSLLLIVIFTALAFSTYAVESAPRQRLHRAYEPASIQLDINLQQKTLSLFLSMNSEAANAITKQSTESLLSHLNEFAPLATIPEEANCQQTQKQFLVDIVKNHSLTTESSIKSSDRQQITGYMEYQCQNPDSLSHLQFHGFKAMPGLKHTSVWLISDHWQSKQQLSKNHQRIQLQKKRGLTHFLLNLFD